jgi:hypothetical protein
MKYLLIILLFNYGFVRAQNSEEKANHKISNGIVKCDGGASILLSDLLSQRSVSSPSLSYNAAVPENCSARFVSSEIDKLIQTFKNEDKNNIKSVINNFCSHYDGWIEYHAGTCQAGGPPPICTASHWKKANIVDAIKDYENELKKLTLTRANKIKQAQKQAEDKICSCWVSELKKAEDNSSLMRFKQTLVQNKGIYGEDSFYSKSSVLQFPCMGGCPPNYVCNNGYCEKEGNADVDDKIEKASEYLLKKSKEKAIEKAEDLAKEQAENILIADALKGLLDNLGSWGKKFLKGMDFLEKHNLVVQSSYYALNPTELGGGNSEYMKRIVEINNSANRLELLYQEALRFKKGQNQVRDISYIKQDIMKERINMGSQVQLLNLSRKEVTFDCKGCCEQILDYQNENIISYATKLINFNFID